PRVPARRTTTSAACTVMPSSWWHGLDPPGRRDVRPLRLCAQRAGLLRAALGSDLARRLGCPGARRGGEVLRGLAVSACAVRADGHRRPAGSSPGRVLLAW